MRVLKEEIQNVVETPFPKRKYIFIPQSYELTPSQDQLYCENLLCIFQFALQSDQHKACSNCLPGGVGNSQPQPMWPEIEKEKLRNPKNLLQIFRNPWVNQRIQLRTHFVLTPWFPMRQIGVFQPIRRASAKLSRISWIVSKGRAAVFL